MTVSFLGGFNIERVFFNEFPCRRLPKNTDCCSTHLSDFSDMIGLYDATAEVLYNKTSAILILFETILAEVRR
jgi:hypothetical protein